MTCRGQNRRSAREARAKFRRRFIQCDDNFEILRFLARRATNARGAARAIERAVSHFGHVTHQHAIAESIDLDARFLAEFDVHDVGFVDFDFGGDDGQVRDGHQCRSRLILNSDDGDLAFVHGQVRNDAVERRTDRCLGILIPRTHERGALLRDAGGRAVALLQGLRRLGFGLRKTRLGGIECGGADIIIGLGAFECFLGDQSFFRHLLRAIEILFRANEVGFGSRDLRLGGSHRRFGGTDGCAHAFEFRLRSLETCLRRINIGFALDRFELHEKIAGLHAVAFLHRKTRNAAHHVRADVHGAFRFDLAIGRNRLGEILPNRAPSLHCNDSAISREDAVADD